MSSRESLAQRPTPRPSSSKQQQAITIGYQGVPQSQKTVNDMNDNPDLMVKNSGPTGTPLRKQALQNTVKKTFTKQPTYLGSCKTIRAA